MQQSVSCLLQASLGFCRGAVSENAPTSHAVGPAPGSAAAVAANCSRPFGSNMDLTMSLRSSFHDPAPTAKRLRGNSWQQDAGPAADSHVQQDRLVRV